MSRAQLKDQADASLEIISIGSLYSGPWAKKYWSSSRGKDRFPYPVGYQAVRDYNGIKYKIEVHEGPKGPLFMILSMDGRSFSGQTPDIAWEMFQRKSCLHTKIWHGKRSSCKVDGVEFFGLKNPFIQRLLRELVANVSGTAELDPSNLCSKASGSAQTAVEQHCVDECKTAKLVSSHERSKSARKRSRIQGIETAKSPNGSNLKKARNHGSGIRSMTAEFNSVSANDGNQGFCEKAICVQEELAVSETTQVAHNVSIGKKHHDRLSTDKLEYISREMEIDDNSGFASFQKDYCPDTEDNNHDASDTSDQKQVIFESAPISFEKKNLNELDIIIPEESVMDAHPEEICSWNRNSGSKRNDFDSVGQDMVKSMMTYLLPQAVPLLEENSDRKKTATSNLETFPCDENTKDVWTTEKEGREKQEYMNIQHGNYKFVVPCLELPKTGLDNLEGGQHYDNANINGSFSSFADNDQAKEDMKPVDYGGFQFSGRMNELLVNHHEASGSKKSRDSENGKNLLGTCQEGNLYVSECPPSCSYSGRVLNECPLNLQRNSCKVDQKTPEDYKESNGDEQPCPSESFSQLSHAQSANDSSVRSTSAFSEALNKEVILGKEAVGIDTSPFSQVPSIVYSRRKAQKVSHLAKEENHPSEASNTSDLRKHYGTEASSTKSPHSSGINVCTLPGNQLREDLLSEPTCREPPPINCSYETTMKAETGLEKICHRSPTLDLNEASPQRDNKSHNSGLLDKHVLKEDLEGCVDGGMIEHNNVLSPNKYELFQDVGETFRDESKDSYPHGNVELYREAEGMSKIVGSYLHPMPVLSIFLSNVENVIHICVLCGLSVEKNRTLITYTVELKEPRLGYPSMVGHTTVMVPTLKDYLGKEVAVERTGFQQTLDGNFLVLVGGIEAPLCRTGSINCPCSTCTSRKFEENVVKIVQVKYGYVSIIANLRSVDSVHCILVCGPDQLVAVGSGGRLHLWVMDSTWSKQIEGHTIPSEDHISPNLVELQKVPEFSNLVVGHNGYGEFSLWDIQKRAMMSRFFTPSASVNQFFPISLFRWKETESFTSNFNSRDYVKELSCATNTSSMIPDEHSSLQLKDTAIWLFASTTSDSNDPHNYLPTGCQKNHAELWKLMLLANSTVTFGAELDLRASAIGASAGRGIIGTQDGLVYVWELSTGNKLGTLLRFEGASVFCIATDNREGGVVAVASGSRLLVCLLSSQ
ncbi:uncharacterized protein LOC111467538 isoform X1 [Cucurbita maxima]|uniref:Uncharacterized protein LOC111467538 isoform X1 n=1 Tax=Cucurbita maxima TaxID=3661 RepID=A0A6J1HXG7_CUCMA|nr:uncharacterized protein LOC111467538 isoform X1 [Cucurbita maxima]